MRLAATRYLRDRKRAAEGSCAFLFDPDAARDVCDFIEKLPHVEGAWDTPEIVLHASHVFFLVNLFGFRKIEDGTRRFTSALFAVARKNAKSTLAAAVLIYCLCCENEPGPQVISAATTGAQARVIFNVAKKMVEKTPDLREMFGVEALANSIVNWDLAGNFRPINSKASSQDGLNPSHTGIDEIHAHKTHDLVNVLQSAAGARRNSLWLYTTTEGYDTPGPWPEMRHYARQVLDGVIEDGQADHFLFVIYALDDEEGRVGEPGYRPADEDFDEPKWVKANPLIEVNPVLLQKIREAAVDAKQIPSRHAEFKIKRLNRQSSTVRGWIDIPKWKRCGTAVDLKMLEGKECYGGLDGASTLDLMSFRLLWRIEDFYYTMGWRWIPGAALAARTERGTVPYQGWVQAGLLKITGDEAIDYAIVEKDILDVCARFKPKAIAYDSWNLRDLVARMKKAGLEMQEFRQGSKSYHPPMQELEQIYVTHRLATNGDAVLNWCASNIVPRYDENLAMAPDKKKSPDKIDDMCALLMAKGAMGVAPPSKKFQLLFA